MFLFVGESGSGKTTLAYELQNRFGYKVLESYTTRPKRSENEQGHTFVDEFPNDDTVVASTYFDGNYYWGTKQQVEENDIWIVDIKGVKNIFENYKGDKEIKVVEILVPEMIRTNRMRLRGDDAETVHKRVVNDKSMFSEKEWNSIYIDKVVVNVDFENCIDSLRGFMERC